jgi:FimV-like protein
MDSSWDLVSPFDSSTPDVHPLPDASLLPEPELEWDPVPDLPLQAVDFLDEFSDVGQSLQHEPLQLEPLSLAPLEPNNAGKLEQAQTCIDDGDLDNAIALLNELLKDGDEPLRQTARSLLAGIR